MNKKFSTLVAGVLLASGVGASAQTFNPQVFSSEPEIRQAKYYALGVGSGATNVVSVTETADGTSVTDLNSTLWEIQYSYPNGSASSPDFTFVNKATGIPLQVDPKKATLFSEGTTYSTSNSSYVEMSGSVSTWKWKDFVETQVAWCLILLKTLLLHW